MPEAGPQTLERILKGDRPYGPTQPSGDGCGGRYCDLARAYRSLGPGHNICLSRKKDWVTSDGRFATELAIDGELSGTMAERHQVHQIICRFITRQGVWEKGNPNDLKFRSKLQLKALKGLGTGPLSGDDKKLLGITSPPKGAALTACAKGCATLIRSGRAAKPDGKKEAEIIIEAAANANPQLGKRLKAAVEEKKGPFEFSSTTLQNLDNALASVPGRLSTAISSLQSPNDQTLKIVERFFKPNENSPFSDFSDSKKSCPKIVGNPETCRAAIGVR